jgi:hypothetical protein
MSGLEILIAIELAFLAYKVLSDYLNLSMSSGFVSLGL